LSPRNRYSSLSFIRIIESILVVVEIDLLPSLKTRLPIEYKSLRLSLSVSLSLDFYFAFHYRLLTVNDHHHQRTYYTPSAIYNRLCQSKHQIDRPKARRKRQKNVIIIPTDIKFTFFFFFIHHFDFFTIPSITFLIISKNRKQRSY
jgi:hypothetical protein